MTEDDDKFLSNVKELSGNETLRQVLDLIEKDCVDRWKVGVSAEHRESAWLELQGINRLRGRIASLCDDERVRNHNFRRRIS